MHDLNTINRLNAETHADAINAARRQGKYVVALYAGLHLVGFSSHDDSRSVVSAFGAPVEAGERRVIYGPITGPARDQSEDRRQPFSLEQLAALGRRSVGDPAPAFA